jgi:hypothetical protein
MRWLMEEVSSRLQSGAVGYEVFRRKRTKVEVSERGRSKKLSIPSLEYINCCEKGVADGECLDVRRLMMQHTAL